jgi:L-fuculose-phosphate aldolase
MTDRLADARRDVWEHARKMWQAGLVAGSSGNLSRRIDSAIIGITPTSIPYDVMTPDDIVVVVLATSTTVQSRRAPSYELPMHVGIYRARPDVHAIVHTHSQAVTTLSILRRPLPPVIDEMMVTFGGPIEVAEYSFTGTEALGDHAVRALGDRSGAMLASHGNVCIGPDLPHALHVAITMESCARIYLGAMQVGIPAALPEEAIAAGRRMYEKRKEMKR